MIWLKSLVAIYLLATSFMLGCIIREECSFKDAKYMAGVTEAFAWPVWALIGLIGLLIEKVDENASDTFYDKCETVTQPLSR